MAETDVLTPDTATSEPEALEPQVLDTAEDSEDADTETQTEDTRDFEAELEAARTAAKEEAVKELQTEELLKAHRQNVARSNQFLATEVGQEIRKTLAWAANAVEEGKMTAAQLLSQVNVDNLAKGIGQQIASSVSTQQVNGHDTVQAQMLAEVYPNWRVPNELARAKEVALANGDTIGYYRVQLEIVRAAARENEAQAEAKKMTAAELEKSKKAADVARLQKTGTNGGPAKIGGAASPSRMTLAQIESMPTSQWLAMPKEQRDRLLANATR